jgi:hypothetical protein
MSKQFEGFDYPNTTPVPDIVFDELLSILTGNELKVLLYIIRRTYGFGKNADAISLSQFKEGIVTHDKKVLDKGCGIKHNRTILAALASLEEKGYVIPKKRQTNSGDSDTTIYKLRFKKSSKDASEEQSDKEVVTPGNDVVTPGNDGGYPTSPRWLPQVTTVVTPGNTQETVLQDTDLQETVRQESVSVAPTSETPAHEDTHPSFSNSSSQQKDKSQVNTTKKARWELLLDYWDSKYGPSARPDRVVEKAKDMMDRMEPTREQVDKVCAELKARHKPITFETMYNNWHLLKEVEEREKAQTQPQPPGPIGVSGLPRIVTSSARPQVIPPVRRAERNR